MASRKNEGVQYNFLNDRPTSRDEIGTHSMVADSLLKIIHSKLKRPFVVGLFGAWGVGKSSIVEMIQDKAKEDEAGTKVVVVDAWRTHMETFLRQFVKKLARELLSEKQAKEIAEKTDIKKVINQSRWKPGSRATKWFYIFVGVVVALGLILLINYFMSVDSEFPADKIAILFLTALIAMYFQFILPKYSVRTDSSEENVTIHDVTHFREIYFEDIIDRCNEETVCIVIDNLDRVGAEDAVAIMRAIKTFIVDVEEKGPTEESKDAIPHKLLNKVVFIIPCDDGALRQHVVKRDSKESGNEFLRKFFNVALRIPALNDRDCYHYACNLLDVTNLELSKTAKDRIANIITSLFGNNPRQPKIFINNFLARYIVAETFEKDGRLPERIVTAHPDWFAVYVALDSEFSDVGVPKTVEGLHIRTKQGWRRDAEDERGGKMNGFLQKIDLLVRRITREAWASYYYLKKANDYLIIDGLEELEEAALKGTDDFPDKLEEVREKHPSVIELLWGARSGVEARIKIMQSILKAKEQIADLSIRGRVPEEMASLIRDNIEDLPLLPADVVYQEILRTQEDILHKILYDIVATDSNGSEPDLYSDGGPKEFQVELVGEILVDDGQLSIRTRDLLGKAVEFLGGRSDRLTIPAIENGSYPCPNIMGKGTTLFREGSDELCPADLVTFCGGFEGDKCIKQLIQVVDVLNQNLIGDKYTTDELCEAANRVKELINREDAKGLNVAQVNIVNTITALDKRYVADNDWDERYAVLKTLKEYSEFAKFTQWQNNATSTLINRGGGFLKSGEENVVCKFLKKDKEIVRSRFAGVLPAIAVRSEKLCHVIFDVYPESIEVVMKTVFPNRPEWIAVWVEKRSNRLKKMKVRGVTVQSALLGLAPNANYRIEIYKALSFLDVSGSKNAQTNRENHFSTLIGARQPLTIPENLAFVLERFLTTQYSGNKDQQSKLNDAFGKIDQGIVSPELRKLIRDYKKLKKNK